MTHVCTPGLLPELNTLKNNRAVFWLMSLPPAAWLVLFFAIPLSLIWLLSFGEKDGLVDVNITGTLDNYIRSFEPVYLKIFWKTVWISVLATGLTLLIAYPLAYFIAFSSERLKPWLLMAVILPFWINLLIRTYALIAVFRTRGYVNFTLEWFWDLAFLDKLIGPFQPLELLYNNGAVVVGLVYVYLPFMVLPLYAAIEKLDRSFLEASVDLGASRWQTFWRVTVPLTMTGIATGCLLVLVLALGTFLTPELLGGANAVMIGNVIERQFKAANDWPFGAALSFLLMYATFAALLVRALLARRANSESEAPAS
ncbi:MAG: ABC transporter permease [Burkholderiaceae bacterium]